MLTVLQRGLRKEKTRVFSGGRKLPPLGKPEVTDELRGASRLLSLARIEELSAFVKRLRVTTTTGTTVARRRDVPAILQVAEAPWSVAEWAVAIRFDHP